MSKRILSSVAVVLAGLPVLLVARGAPDGVAAQEFPALAPDAPAGTGEVVPCEIERVEGEARCGRYRVFEDREVGEGRTVDLAFVILEATGEDPVEGEVVIPLPGGPGQSFTGSAVGISRGAADLRRTRDLLLVDVRGVGRSQSLDCPAFDIPLADRFGTVFPPAHIRTCRETLAKRARLDLYTTNQSVDDLDELRRWLGYESVNLNGTSYGTRVAQVYMRRHPDSIRTVTLNSVAPVFQHGYVYMARSLQRSLDLVVEGCASTPECASAHPDLRARLDEVLARLDRAPAELEVAGVPVAFTKGDFSYALRGLLYGRAAQVPGVIDRAWEGDFEEVAGYYLERAGWVGGEGGEAGYHFSALCPEDIAPLTDEEVERLSAGTFMGDHLIAGYRDVCRAWDVAELPASFWEPVESDLPVLIISGERDPVTPPDWGDAVAEHLPNSLHIVVPGGGHGPRNDCTRAIEARFLETASVEGLDPSCVGETASALRPVPGSDVSRSASVGPGAARPRAAPTATADGAIRSVALRVHHAQRMEDFYANAFGVRFRSVTTGGFESRFGELGGLTLKLVPIREAPDFEGFAVHQLGIEVDALERVVRLAVEAGGRRMGDPVVVDGVRQVAIRDPRREYDRAV